VCFGSKGFWCFVGFGLVCLLGLRVVVFIVFFLFLIDVSCVCRGALHIFFLKFPLLRERERERERDLIVFKALLV
jgi:hypothetical protein